jgi:methyl-accepting chemotaxis protein
MLGNLRIGQRLAAGFAVALAFCALIAASGVWRMQQIGNDMRAIMADPLATERLLSDLSRNISNAVTRTAAVAKSSDTSLAAFFEADSKASSKASGELLKKIEALISSPEEKQLFDKISENRKAYIAGKDAVFKLKEQGRAEDVDKALKEQFLPAAKRYEDMVAEFLSIQRQHLDAQARAAEDAASAGSRQVSVLAVVVILFGILFSWRLTASIVAPLQRAVASLKRVAAGDLSEQIEADTRDETGQLLQAMQEMNASLARLVGQVRQGSDAISGASAEIAAGNMDLSARTEQQAAALEETASSMEELTVTVKNNAGSAREANALAGAASEVAGRGGEVVSQVVATMESIHDSAKRIVDIISVIDGIAFQTNILALNAAVEAARAGEQGRGFAVVASEVRSLAQRSAGAAREIKELIGDSVQRVEAGSRLVNEAGATMVEVVDSVGRVSGIIAGIMAASEEQSAGIEEVNRAIAQMDQVTQQNAALVEESAAASAAMRDQAGLLARTVGAFRLRETPVQAGLPATRVAAPAVPVKSGKAAGITPVRASASLPARSGAEWQEF